MADNLVFNLGVETGTAVSEINKFFQTFDQGAAQASSKLRKAFNEPIKTEVEISLKNGELVAKKIESSKSKAKQLKDVYRALNGEIGKTPNALKRQMSILKTLQGNTEKYKKGTNKLTAEWKKVEEQIRRVKQEQDRLGTAGGGGGMDNLIGKFALVQTAANLATSAIMGMGRAITDLAATGVRMESLMLQLEAFAGGAEQAKMAYEEFANTSRKTPFNVEQVAQAGKIMMAFGLDTGTATEMTDRLGIAASATGGDLNNLARNLGQIAAQGQAYTRDLTQFAMQGIPIWGEMSKVTGRSVTELKKLAAEGQISFEIVSAALKNLTKEGSSFEEVAKRMEETFAGRMAQIETGLVNLSKGMIEAFNQFDQATGKVVSGAMLEFAKMLESLAAKAPEIGYALGQTFNDIGSIFSTIGGFVGDVIGFFGDLYNALAKVLVPLQAIKIGFDGLRAAFEALGGPAEIVKTLLAAISGPAIVIGIGLVIKGIYGMMTATYAYIKAQIISLGLMGPKGWFILMGAAAATAGTYLMLKDNLETANEEMEENNKTQAEAAEAAKANAGGQKDLKIAIDDTTESTKRQAEETKLAADKAKTAYQEQKDESDALKQAIFLRIDNEKREIDGLIEKKKAAIQQEKDAYREIQEITKQRYDDEKQRVSEIYDQKLAALDLERDALSQRGPKEQELYELNKRELEDKLKSADLSEKERLELEARLERMERQEKMAEIAAQRKEVELKKQQELKQLEIDREAELKKQEEAHEQIIGKLEKEQEKLEAQKKALDEKKRKIQEMDKGVQAYNGNLDKGIAKLQTQIKETQRLKKEWQDLARIAKQAKLDAASAKADNNSSSSGGANRWAGGPVTGGTSYTVNEKGKEAFLSAAGKLSMINAPAWGQWKAPTSGTVIPANLTKELNVPTGGINLNGNVGSNASRAGAGGMSSMVRAIQSSMGGDTISNNVTIQAINPTQAASDMMVNMNRVRRRRYT